ncbi:MAG: glutathione S-transferase family protein [Pseudomonadota bacterium]
MLKLVGSHTSPFVRKTRIVTGELGLWDRVELVIAEGTALDADPGLRGAHPLKKVPFLELEDGALVYDSRTVCEALCQMVPGQTLLPEAGPARIETLTRQALVDGLCDAAVGAAYETRLRPPEKVWDDWIEAQLGKTARALDAIEATPPPAGRFDLGDCALAGALPYLELRYPDRPWREGRPKLAAWWETAKNRPAVAETL